MRYHRPVRLLTPALLFVACLWATPIWAAGKPVAEASLADHTAARNAYIGGKGHYDAAELEKALIGFRWSYAIVASPNSHLMIARVLAQLGRSSEAYQEMVATKREAERVLRLGPSFSAKYEKTLATATALAIELRQKVGLISIEIDGRATLPDGVMLTIAGRRVARLDTPTVVDPGRVLVALQTAWGRSEANVTVAAGGDVTAEISLPSRPVGVPVPVPVSGDAPSPAPPPSLVMPEEGVSVPARIAYGSLVVGGAGLVVFGVFGVLTLQTFDQLQEDCPAGICPRNRQRSLDNGRAYQTAANVGLVVGVTGAIASVAMFLLDARHDSLGLRPTRDGLAIGVDF